MAIDASIVRTIMNLESNLRHRFASSSVSLGQYSLLGALAFDVDADVLRHGAIYWAAGDRPLEPPGEPRFGHRLREALHYNRVH